MTNHLTDNSGERASGKRPEQVSFDKFEKVLEKHILDRVRQLRLGNDVGTLAAATIEVTAPPLAEPLAFFEPIADIVQPTETGYVVLLKQPIGALGFQILVVTTDFEDKSRDSLNMHSLDAGFVAEEFDKAADVITHNNGWTDKHYSRSVYARRERGERYGVDATHLGNELARRSSHGHDEVIYADVPMLTDNEVVQRRIEQIITDNMRERRSEDVIKPESESLTMVTIKDGQRVAEADVIFARDFYLAHEKVNKDTLGYHVENRSKAVFMSLARWLAFQDTGSPKYAAEIHRKLPYATATDVYFDKDRYKRPQITFNASVLKEIYEDVARGYVKIPDFGPKSVQILRYVLRAHEEAKVRRELEADLPRPEPPEPQVEVGVLNSINSTDEKDLERLFAALSPRLEGKPLDKRVLDRIIFYPGYEQLVARINGRIVGAATLSIVIGLGSGSKGYLNDFVTDPDMRGRGIGDIVFEEVVKWCRDRDIDLTFTSKPAREDAHRFYRNHGAEIQKTTVFQVRTRPPAVPPDET